MALPDPGFALLPEQENLYDVLKPVLGESYADRYHDLCRLASGDLTLRVSQPMAGHALRELESLLRQFLFRPESLPEGLAKIVEDRRLRADRADEALRVAEISAEDRGKFRKGFARTTQKEEIGAILHSLGFPENSEVSRTWNSLAGKLHGQAHYRSSYKPLIVGEQFASRYLQPFEEVLRSVAFALQRSYPSLIRHVDVIVAMQDRVAAVNRFISEIPGAVPLQRYFFGQIDTSDWLPVLKAEGLLADRLPVDEDEPHWRPWLPSIYLKKIASEGAPDTLAAVVGIVRDLAGTGDLAIRNGCVDIISALPVAEGALLSDVVAAWLEPDNLGAMLHRPTELVRRFVDGGQPEAALTIAKAFLNVFEKDQRPATLEQSGGLYEYQLKSLTPQLASIRIGALEWMCDLIERYATLKGYLTDETDFSHHLIEPIASETAADYDTYSALVRAAREMAVARASFDTPDHVISYLEQRRGRIFRRIGLHVLATLPEEQSALAHERLMDEELIDADWCRPEYAALALRHYASLPEADKDRLLAFVDSLPDRDRDIWRERATAYFGREPTEVEERSFEVNTKLKAVEGWESVLPAEWRAANDRATLIQTPQNNLIRSGMDESPIGVAQIIAQDIPTLVEFLARWEPNPELSHVTLNALANELRSAVERDPQKFSAAAAELSKLPPLFVIRLCEGLTASVRQQPISWNGAMELISGAFIRARDMALADEGPENQIWLSLYRAARDLLAAGLRQGPHSLPHDLIDSVEDIVLRGATDARVLPVVGAISNSVDSTPCIFATMNAYGMALENLVLFVAWSRQEDGRGGDARSRAIECLREQIDAQGQQGYIVRAIFGQYGWLFAQVDEAWVSANIDRLLAGDGYPFWSSFLLGGHAAPQLLVALRSMYQAELRGEIAGAPPISERAGNSRYRSNQLVRHLVELYLGGALDFRQDDLLGEFLLSSAPAFRRQAMYLIGQVSRDTQNEVILDRIKAYWEYRLGVARAEPDKEVLSDELGSIGLWLIRAGFENSWLVNELVAALQAGARVQHEFSVIQWLASIAGQFPSQAIAALQLIVVGAGTTPWGLMSQDDAIRGILTAGLELGDPDTVSRTKAVVSQLTVIDQPQYLDLIRDE